MKGSECSKTSRELKQASSSIGEQTPASDDLVEASMLLAAELAENCASLFFFDPAATLPETTARPGLQIACP